ncbi:hypothetical protein [Absidia glauca]|uniref:Uncharacterized protein n=1 Tax=Absidia glauca TaxID=4829 RepID=A0A168SP29_ABSGL|nr:hypothetical protein [Absidia glauca]
MISNRLVPVLIAVGVGIGTGVYVFQPLLKEYEADTKGTWVLPEDEARVKALAAKRNQGNSTLAQDNQPSSNLK